MNIIAKCAIRVELKEPNLIKIELEKILIKKNRYSQKYNFNKTNLKNNSF
jgi:hypothetical protein